MKIVMLLGLAALFVFFAIAATWAMASNRMVPKAARDGEMPAFFSVRGGPVGAAVARGAVCSIVARVYGAPLIGEGLIC